MTVQPIHRTASTLWRTREPVTFNQVIGPEQAATMLETMMYEHQRALRANKVKEYAEEMRNGTFRELTQIFIVIYEGKYIIVDGQHRLSAVVSSRIPTPFSVVEKEVGSLEEIARIYSTTDIGARRTPSDIYGAYDLCSEFGIQSSAISRLGAAIKFMETGGLRTGNQQGGHADHIPSMRLYAPYMKEYMDIVGSGHTGRALWPSALRSSTVALALLTLRFTPTSDRQRAVDFWAGVLQNDGINVGDPRKCAYRHLLEARVHSTARRATVSVAYSFRYMANCFNAYMERREITYTRVNDEFGPASIRGVPIDPALWW